MNKSKSGTYTSISFKARLIIPTKHNHNKKKLRIAVGNHKSSNKYQRKIKLKAFSISLKVISGRGTNKIEGKNSIRFHKYPKKKKKKKIELQKCICKQRAQSEMEEDMFSVMNQVLMASHHCCCEMPSMMRLLRKGASGWDNFGIYSY